MRRLLRKVGLGRPAQRAWALYDWANSAFVTVVSTAVFPIYFAQVAAAGLSGTEATQRYGIATSLALGAIGLAAPFLGALADVTGRKKRLLGSFMAAGVLATALLFLVERGDWLLGLALLVVARIGASGSIVFYDSLLPHVAGPGELDRTATAGYAVGYLGGGILLALNLAWITSPGTFGLPEGTLPTRLAFLSVAVWWLLFSVPLFRAVPEPERRVDPEDDPAARAMRNAFGRLARTFVELRRYRHAFLLLLAFLLYNDGIVTIINFATIYGTEIGIGRNALVSAILLVQFLGVPFAFLFGEVADRIGPKRGILIGLAVYMGISVLAYLMETATHFFLLAALVATVQGGTQALSRSLFASLVPEHRSGEFFGFMGVMNKAASVLGPAFFTIAVTLTGSSRSAILSIVLFFVVGGAILLAVDVEQGRRVAREEERRARRVPEAGGGEARLDG